MPDTQREPSIRELAERIVAWHETQIVADKSNQPHRVCRCGERPIPCSSRRHARAILDALDKAATTNLVFQGFPSDYRLVPDPLPVCGGLGTQNTENTP